MTARPSLEALLARDRIIVLAGLAGVTALAWAYLVGLAANMSAVPNTLGEVLAATEMSAWGLRDFTLMLLMWAVMMVGMMVPSAAPMILVFAAFNRKQSESGRPFVSTGVFLLGYLVVWALFSLGATLLQYALERGALLSPMMTTTSPLLGGALLVAAGGYQWTPLKYACLRHCRTPPQFILYPWRPGAGGALRMGLEHGAYCLGCCWILMGLLFVGGVMNLLWIALIAGFVLLEKALRLGEVAGRATGVALAVCGLVVLVWA